MTPSEIANSLRTLCTDMIIIGAQMDYYGGFNDALADKGRQLVSAALLVGQWASEIDNEVAK